MGSKETSMSFTELVESLRKVKHEQTRADQENYFEVVVTKNIIEPIVSMLQSYFGSPMKPEGKDPSKTAERCAEPYGGIWRNQIMYMHTVEQGVEAALLWPWNDGNSITVKLIRDDGSW